MVATPARSDIVWNGPVWSLLYSGLLYGSPFMEPNVWSLKTEKKSQRPPLNILKPQKEVIQVISFEPISERVTPKSFHEASVKSVKIDVIDTFWRAMTRKLLN